MQSTTGFLDTINQQLGRFLPDKVGAVVILFAGWFISRLLGAGVTRAMRAVLARGEATRDVADQTADIAGKLVYYLVFLFFLVFSLNSLGYGAVLAPITGMFEDLFSAAPNLLAAGLIGCIGFIIARVLSSLTAIAAGGLQSLADSAGLGDVRLPRVLSQAVFIIVFVPALLAALEKLDMAVISSPATQMLTAFMAAVPNIVAATLILLLAWFVGRYVARAVTAILDGMGAAEWPEKMGLSSVMGSTSLARLAGHVLLFFILLGAGIAAVDKLGMPMLSAILDQMLTFAADVVVGLIILAVGSLLANLAHRALTETGSSLAGPARFAILGLVLAMGLKAMGLADEVVSLAFGLTVGALAVAFALAFGLGGREAAGRQLQQWLERLNR
ncbi:MAG: mechanosensitive ion channel [Halioglobus sp.]|nr:mechanosensitive ion channel [Halioglobus sp.]